MKVHKRKGNSDWHRTLCGTRSPYSYIVLYTHPQWAKVTCKRCLKMKKK